MAAIKARRRQRSWVGTAVERLAPACGIIPYGLIALALRLVMARVFFLSGQEKMEGPRISVHLPFAGPDVSIVLPAEVKASTLALFETQYAAMPIPPETAATIFSYAEFVLPICLVLGFATRFAALALLVETLLLQIYVSPQVWWSSHVYWICILLVLLSLGPGAISLDALLRYLYRREEAVSGE
jgi:putative oxidoreductase